MAVEVAMLDKDGDKVQQSERCSDCGCSLNHPLSETHPESTSSNSKCLTCQMAGNPSNGRRPNRHVRMEPHSCNLCTKTFISSAHLALHLASHNKERKFKCNICSKYFHQSSHLVAHKVIHSGDRPFKCPECGKTFGRASHLKTHRRLHTGEKPFKCTYCEKSFTQKAGLLAHVRLHNGEKPFKCEQCGAAFRTVSSLLTHKAQKEQTKAASVQQLKQPEKGQASSDDLKCGVCCRTFVRSSYIRLHIRLNRGQRPYHCKVCNKTFAKLDTFMTHCDKHLSKKKDTYKEEQEKVVKPPLFIPLSRPPSPESSASKPSSSEVNTRSKSKAKIKTE